MRYQKKAIGTNRKPGLINIDNSGANTAAIKQFNKEERMNEDSDPPAYYCVQLQQFLMILGIQGAYMVRVKTSTISIRTIICEAQERYAYTIEQKN